MCGAILHIIYSAALFSLGSPDCCFTLGKYIVSGECVVLLHQILSF